MSVEESIRSKLTAQFAPSHLYIRNECVDPTDAARPSMPIMRLWSRRVAAAVRLVRIYANADFFVEMVSEAFTGKPQIARHRAVNGLLSAEYDKGMHALSMRLKTPAEEAKEKASQCGCADRAT